LAARPVRFLGRWLLEMSKRPNIPPEVLRDLEKFGIEPIKINLLEMTRRTSRDGLATSRRTLHRIDAAVDSALGNSVPVGLRDISKIDCHNAFFRNSHGDRSPRARPVICQDMAYRHVAWAALARPAHDDTNAYYAAEVQSVLRPEIRSHVLCKTSEFQADCRLSRKARNSGALARGVASLRR
jgi:hypothetical protein